MIGRASIAAIALCAVAAAAPGSRVSSGTGTSSVAPGTDVRAMDSRALASHALVVASAIDVPPVWIGALPPPPTEVDLPTRSYGTVKFDHPAHLARRVACRECHGPGPVRKVEFTPRLGHDRCRGCHVQLARGPANCKGCHVLPPKEEELAKAEPEEAVPVLLPAPPTAAESLMALQPAPPPSFRRTVDFGVTTIASHAGVDYGPAVNLVAHYGDDLLAYTLAVPGGATHGRLQLLLGGGREFDLPRRLRWSALAVAGLDATFNPGMVLPGAGARVGLHAPVSWPAFRTVSLEATALVDLASSPDAGRHAGDLSFGLTLSAGLPISR